MSREKKCLGECVSRSKLISCHKYACRPQYLWSLGLRTLIEEARSIPMRELLEHNYSADHIYKAIVDGILYVDLAATRLDILDELTLFCDKARARAARLLDGSRLAIGS